MNIRTMYIRDRQSHQIGSLAIAVDRKNKRASYQFSMAHPKDMKDERGRSLKFDSAKGRLLALERLIESPIHAVINSEATMHDITSAVMSSLSKSEAAPSRAIKFARSWLKETIVPKTITKTCDFDKIIALATAKDIRVSSKKKAAKKAIKKSAKKVVKKTAVKPKKTAKKK